MGNCVGALSGVSRDPVKSMMGEALGSSIVWERGVLGDRSYALVDRVTGRIASAKNPRRWPTLLRFSAAYTEPPLKAAAAPVRITLPHGEFVHSDQEDANDRLSTCLDARVTLRS
ncbi:MAG TPA: MOSC N-terminal beta barrel domain-containing protein [Candidatus Binataceae bacterium]